MAGETGVRRRRKAERPTEILQASLEEFSANGFAATRLEDVATRAGITKGTIYIYFGSKEDLFIATLKEKSRPMIDNLQALTREEGPSAFEILRRHLAFVAEQMVEDPCGRDILRILLAEGHRFPHVVDRWSNEVLEPILAAVGGVVRQGVESGEFRSSAAAEFPQLVMAPIILCNNWLALFGERRPLDVRGFFEATVDLLARGLLAEEPATSPSAQPSAGTRLR